MSKYKTDGFGKNKADELAKFLPAFSLTSDGELEVDIDRELNPAELSRIKSIMGKEVKT